jgi:hypothetical protein
MGFKRTNAGISYIGFNRIEFDPAPMPKPAARRLTGILKTVGISGLLRNYY